MARPEVRAKQRAYQREWKRQPRVRAKEMARQRQPAARATKKRHKLRKKYGLSEAAFLEMKRAQGNACAACRNPFGPANYAHVDHDHTTKAVRGLLCRACNMALGHAHDSIKILQGLINYMQRFV
jgi:hypothetical protein